MFPVIFLGAALLFVHAAAADGEEYEVEIIVFERAATAPAFEAWDFSSKRARENMLRIRELAAGAAEHEILPGVYRLRETGETLREAGHRILAVASWRQPASLHRDAPLIALGGAPGRAVFTGFARIYTTALIYADLDLQLLPGDASSLRPSPPEMRTTMREDAPRFFLSEKRRVKFNELHYFDHPRFGAILGVWPAPDSDAFAL